MPGIPIVERPPTSPTPIPVRMSRFPLAVLALALAALPCRVAAQQDVPGPAADYRTRLDRLVTLAQGRADVAPVRNLVLRRDVGTLVFDEGTLALLPPIGGMRLAAVFKGTGHFHFRPPLEIERNRMRLFWKTDSIAEEFNEVVLFFADSTLEQLEAALQFAPGEVPGALRGRYGDALDYLGDPGRRYFDPDFLRPVLNAARSGFFYAHFDADHRDPWVFLLNPNEFEGVQLRARSERVGGIRYAESVAQFPRQGDTVRTGGRAERRGEARVDDYRLQVALPQTGTGEVAFHARGTLTLAADTVMGPWVPFLLYEELTVDSARWQDGTPAQVFKADKTPALWVRLPGPIKPGDRVPLTLGYQGNLIDGLIDWFFIKSSISWYPVSLDQRQHARFDLTFDSPANMTLASIGQRTDSTVLDGQMVRTHWLSQGAIRNASFNLGKFDVYTTGEAGVPPVTVLWSDGMHKRISQGGAVLAGRNMKQQVGADVSNALKFYASVFGEPPVQHFYATEIPWLHGEAWPGIVGLSYVTFQQTDQEGQDEFFRAHEVAHQWWGIAVDYATYRDRWLSEGLASFSGLWYLQARRNRNDPYFRMLRQWKAGIMLRRDRPLPIWLGHRVATASTPEDYSALVYDKGAWVFHMLRILLLDLKSMNEDRFTRVMQQYYCDFRGGAGSTADFQHTVEQVVGQDMDWFFDQWVYGSGVPTYRVAWKSEDTGKGTSVVRLRVQQDGVPPAFLMYVPVAIDLGNNQVIRVRVKVTGATSEITLPEVPGKPKEVRFNDLDGVLAEVKTTGW